MISLTSRQDHGLGPLLHAGPMATGIEAKLEQLYLNTWRIYSKLLRAQTAENLKCSFWGSLQLAHVQRAKVGSIQQDYYKILSSWFHSKALASRGG